MNLLKNSCFLIAWLSVAILLYSCNGATSSGGVEVTEKNETSAHHLYQKGLQQMDSAHFEPALLNFNKAVKAYAAQQNNTGIIQTLTKIATIQAELGDFTQATETIDKAFVLSIPNRKDSLLLTASLQATLGDISLKKGLLPQADSLFTNALAIRQKNLGVNHESVAQLYRYQGKVAFMKGQLEVASELTKQSYTISSKILPPFHQELADVHSLLGAINDRKADFEKAQVHYEKCLVINKKVRGEFHPETGKVLVNLGNLYNVLGSSLKAREHFEMALTILKKTYGERHALLAVVYNNMAILDMERGDLEKAIVYYKNALDIFAEKLGPTNPQVALCYSNIAAAQLQLKQPDQALENLQQSLNIRMQQVASNGTLASSLYVNMAGAYTMKGQYGDAIQYLSKAADAYTKQGVKVHPVLAECYSGLAETYARQQEFDKAFTHYRMVEKIFLEKAGKDFAKLAQIYNRVALIHYDLNHLDSSMHYFQKAVTVIAPELSNHTITDRQAYSKLNSPIYLIWALHGKARVFFKLYQATKKHNISYLQEAFKLYGQISGLLDQTVLSFGSKESKLYLLESANAISSDAMQVAYELYEKTRDNTYANFAFAYSEKNKNVLLLEFLKRVSAKNTAGLPDSVAQREEFLQSSIDFYEKRTFEEEFKPDSVRNKSSIAEWQSKISALKKEQMEFNAALEGDFNEYYKLKYNTEIVTLHNIQPKLKDNQLILEYFVGDSSIYLFTISKEKYHFFKMAKNATLEEDINNLRKAIFENNYSLYVYTARNLYDALLQKAAPVTKGFSKWIIITDGALSYVPFDILLPTAGNGREQDYLHLPYLLKKHQMSYNYSATVAMETNRQSRTSADGKLVGFAPAFGEEGVNLLPATFSDSKEVVGGKLDRLEGAKAELETISTIFDGDYFYKDVATEKNFKQIARNNKIIHLATHAVINDKNPAYSHLVFASDRDKNNTEDGLLYTHELYNLRLRAELVTLSACNTGVGKISKGEGVMSLARGFAYAGCPNIVMSLWPASDKTTAFIMEKFYKALADGLPKEEALHQAKLAYLAESDLNTANPYFWGSFVFIGEPTPLTSRPGSNMWLWLMIGAGVVGAVILVWYRVWKGSRTMYSMSR